MEYNAASCCRRVESQHGLGERVEEQAAPPDAHAPSTGARTSGGEDLH